LIGGLELPNYTTINIWKGIPVIPHYVTRGINYYTTNIIENEHLLRIVGYVLFFEKLKKYTRCMKCNCKTGLNTNCATCGRNLTDQEYHMKLYITIGDSCGNLKAYVRDSYIIYGLLGKNHTEADPQKVRLLEKNPREVYVLYFHSERCRIGSGWVYTLVNIEQPTELDLIRLTHDRPSESLN
jgi:hypothetical protein